MTELDLAPLGELLAPFASMGRAGLLPALQAAQHHYGWLLREVVAQVAHTLAVPLADVHGVIEFYSLLYNEPVGREVLHLCMDPACALKGASQHLDSLCAQYGIRPGQTTPDGELTITPSPCLGMCDHAPARLSMRGAQWSVRTDEGQGVFPRTRVYGYPAVLTARCGKERATTLREYGGYQGLEKARSMSPAAVIEEIKASGLMGRGGAAFPTGLKWESAAQAPGREKYIICNADESEPGTFKDRVLLLDDPHSTIEGMCIAAYAVGARKGYIYLRGEYPYILPVLHAALDEARAAGYLGDWFEIEIRVGAGAYICGEETALFESIEGKRGFPRIKPPFPTTNGLFDKPTVINNVETLCNVPLIVRLGAAGYRQMGTEKSPGPKLFCISGDVARPGVYEAPFGITLRELLSLAGVVEADAGADAEAQKRMEAKIQAVLFGGAAGAFATPAHLDVKLTFEDLRAAGLPLGSGVIMVFDTSRDLRPVLARLGRFFAHESCGKCYPCQMGTQRQMEILNRLERGAFLESDLARLQDVGWTMTDASLCGLGQTAASAVLSAMQHFPHLFQPARGS